MKILFITHYSELYGANRSLLILLQELIKKNSNVLLLAPKKGPLLEELDKLGIRYLKIKFWAWMGVAGPLFRLKSILRFLANIFVFPVLLLNVLRFKPSVIYTNSSITPIGIYLSLILKTPHIWHVRELGKLDYNLEYDFGKKHFYSLMRKSDRIIAISEFVKEKVFNGEWKNLRVIYNAVDFKKMNIETESKGTASGSFTFLIMGIIHPSKGIDDAINALGKLKKDFPDIKLVVCGSVEDRRYKMFNDDIIVKLNLTNQVTFTGFVKNPNEMYKSSNAVLVCSKNEAWGRVAAEAMVAGTPVIGFNNGGTKETIENNITGLLYSTVDELADCMKTIIQDKDLVNKLAENAQKFALQKFSVEKYTANIFNIISELAK